MRASGFSVTTVLVLPSINKVDYDYYYHHCHQKVLPLPNVDTNGFQRILASKSFKESGSNLCEAFATLTR